MSQNKTDDKYDSFCRVVTLITDINADRYGKPLVAALHLCNDLADELERLKEAPSATLPNVDDQLQAFARRMFDLSDWPDGGDIDMFAFQEAAIECGLLTPKTMNAPCAENCWCEEFHGRADQSIWKDGVTCYRKAAFLTKAPDAGGDAAPSYVGEKK